MPVGAVIPLYCIIAAESFLAFFLMLPVPLCLPAVKLCSFLRHNVIARTVVHTAAGFLSIFLLSPLWDTWAMHRAKAEASHSTPESLVETTTGEATSQLSACLTAAAIGNMFLLRHLGSTIDDREQLAAQLRDNNIEPRICKDFKTSTTKKSDVPLKAE